MIQFEVLGKCQAKQRPRRGKNGHFFTPKETVNYELEVRWAARIAMKGLQPLTGAVSVELDIIEHVPPSWPSGKRKKALAGELFPTKSDLDNKIKGLLDGMNTICFTDDRLVRNIVARKSYGPEAKVIVKVSEI